MNHKQKVKLARKMRTLKEIKEKTPIFQTAYWEARVKAKQEKQLKKYRKKNDNIKKIKT